MSTYQKHLDAFHRIFDSAYPRSRQADERQRTHDGKFHHEHPTHIAKDEHAVQDRDSGPAPGYHNDASGWVRGQGQPHPHFDHSPPRNRMRR